MGSGAPASRSQPWLHGLILVAPRPAATTATPPSKFATSHGKPPSQSQPLKVWLLRSRRPRGSDMLEILGQAQNPAVIQAHLKKLFAGITKVQFDDTMKQITAMCSAAGEVSDAGLAILLLPATLPLPLAQMCQGTHINAHSESSIYLRLFFPDLFPKVECPKYFRSILREMPSFLRHQFFLNQFAYDQFSTPPPGSYLGLVGMAWAIIDTL